LSQKKLRIVDSTFLSFATVRLVPERQFRPVLSVAELAAKLSRNRTLRTPFLRLIFDDGKKALQKLTPQDWIRWCTQE
jgi:hypothetical protein